MLSPLLRLFKIASIILLCFFLNTANAQVYGGSYTGNGTSQSITAPGFQPDVVIVKRSGIFVSQVKFAGMGTATKDFAFTSSANDRITAVNTTGFTVGADASVNGSGGTHHYLAIKAIAGEIVVGSYTGNSTDSRNITGVGFTPAFVLIVSSAAVENAWRTSSMAGDAALAWASAGSDAQPDVIQSVNADGFQVGTSARANQTGTTYYYIAVKSVAGKFAVGTYSGNGVDDRNITGFGFQPGFVGVKRSDGTTTGAIKTTSTGATTDITLIPNATADAADVVQQLLADGMQVGLSGRTNLSGGTYHWFAFANNGAWPSSISLNSINRTNTSPTNSSSVQFTVTFASSVTGVSSSNFALTTTGVSGASITSVSGSGTTWTVTVNTGTGNGTIRLDMNDATGVNPSINNVPYTSGQVYTIYKTSSTGDYYRTRNTTGSWSTITDWESSADNSYYITASAVPTTSATLVTVQSGHTITLNSVDPTVTALALNGVININGRTLTINSVTGTGTLTGSATSNLAIGGTAGGSAGTLYFTSGSNSLNNFTMNRTGTTPSVAIGNAVNVFGTITPTSGTVNTGGNLTLKSNASGTARIAAGSASGGYINGNVVIERYIPASGNRAWRLLGTAVTAGSAPSIYNAWQEGGGNASGFGTHITRAGGAGTNGFDASTIALSSSIRFWNGAALQAPSNTTSTTVTSNGGAYFLFVRGDRNININNGTATGNTTLRMTGVPNQGNVNNVGNSGDDYSLIPNPYPSAVDFELVRNGNGSSINTFYSWDATLNSVGAYRTVERIGANNYQQTPSGGSAVTDATARYIQSGQAFFIPVNATLNFTESMKTSSSPSFNVFRTTSGGEELVVNLSTVDNSTAILSDGVRIKFDPSYTQTPSSEDIVKLTNFNENLSVINNGTDLVVEKRPMATTADTIDLHLWNTDVKDYRFSFEPLNFTGATAYLADKYLGTTTAIDLTTPGNIDFSVTTAAGSAAPDRFEIVFTPAGPLAATEITISGQEEGKGVRINWHVKDQQDIKAYEVQSSADGRSYNQVATVQAGSKPSYTTLDPEVLKTERYYRIKAVYTDDKTAYSQTLRLQAGVKAGTGIEVSPNPVAGQRIGLQWNNVGEGDYHVTLSNTGGQVVYRTAIKHAGGNGSYTLSPEQMLPAGVYYLSIMGEEREYNQQVLIGK